MSGQQFYSNGYGNQEKVQKQTTKGQSCRANQGPTDGGNRGTEKYKRAPNLTEQREDISDGREMTQDQKMLDQLCHFRQDAVVHVREEEAHVREEEAHIKGDKERIKEFDHEIEMFKSHCVNRQNKKY